MSCSKESTGEEACANAIRASITFVVWSVGSNVWIAVGCAAWACMVQHVAVGALKVALPQQSGQCMPCIVLAGCVAHVGIQQALATRVITITQSHAAPTRQA